MRGSAVERGTDDVGGNIGIPAMCVGLNGGQTGLAADIIGEWESGILGGGSRLELHASAAPIGKSLRGYGMFLRAVAEMWAWRYGHDGVCGCWERAR
jgi:hypothetical protein